MIMDIEQVTQYLPHRHPFLLVDRVIEMELGKRITAIKNVTINEPFFPGHFPGAPVMPGVLILEAMAQAVKPGDQLVLKIDILRETRGIWKYAGRAEVDGEMVAEAELMATLRDK